MNLVKRTLVLLGCLTVFAAVAPVAQATTLEAIRQKGTLVVGVKADSKPWGYVDERGNHIGWEIDMAKEIARRLGVKAELVTVTSSNRIQLLDQGRIDLILATLSDTEQRRRVVLMIEPPYFYEGFNILARKDSGLKKWEDIKGKKLCGVNGSIYNKPMQQQYGAEVITFAGLSEAQAALLAGTCVGLVYGDQILQLLYHDNKAMYADYQIAMPMINEVPWAWAIRPDEKGSEFHKFLQQTVTDMHKTGYLIRTLKQWGIEQAPPMMIEMNKKLK
jgi:polar amino acid transport system substrate-binding protein